MRHRKCHRHVDKEGEVVLIPFHLATRAGSASIALGLCITAITSFMLSGCAVLPTAASSASKKKNSPSTSPSSAPLKNEFLVDGKAAPLSGEIVSKTSTAQSGVKYIGIMSSGEKIDSAYSFAFSLPDSSLPKGFKGKVDEKKISSGGFWKGTTKFVATEDDYDISIEIEEISNKIVGRMRAHNMHESGNDDNKIDFDILFSVPFPTDSPQVKSKLIP